jgi:hypothetical protein
MRFARCAFWEGSYARRGIDLERHFASSPLTITDLDLLALEFNAQLQLVKTVGEAKSGTGKSAPKPLDRALWLAGVARLVHADRAELVTALLPSDRVRATVAELNVTAMSVEDLARREDAVDVEPVADVGAHGPTAFNRTKQAHAQLKREPELERAYWFLRSEVWFQPPWLAAKRTIGVLRAANKWWTPRLDDPAAAALRWLLAEAVSIFTLNAVALCGLARHSAPEMWAATASEKLAEGAIPAHQMKVLSASIDSFVARAVSLAGGAPTPELIGAFTPRPPDYADALIELVSRLARIPSVGLLPRHVDLVAHERLVHRRHVSTDALARIDRGADEDLASARRLIAAFLRGASASVDIVDTALVTNTGVTAS